MKNFLLSTIALIGLLFVSCSHEQTGDPFDEGEPLKVTYSLKFDEIPPTRAFADGSNINTLYAAIYEVAEDGGYTFDAENSQLGNIIMLDSENCAEIDCSLKRGSSYKLIFFAEVDGAYSPSFSADGAVLDMKDGALANDENRDAFCCVVETGVITSSVQGGDISMKRPFGQVNIFAKKDGQLAPGSSSLSVKGMPTKLDFLTGVLSGGEDETYVFSENDCPSSEDAFGDYSGDYYYIGMNYVLAAESESMCSAVP